MQIKVYIFYVNMILTKQYFLYNIYFMVGINFFLLYVHVLSYLLYYLNCHCLDLCVD